LLPFDICTVTYASLCVKTFVSLDVRIRSIKTNIFNKKSVKILKG